MCSQEEVTGKDLLAGVDVFAVRVFAFPFEPEIVEDLPAVW
jgi:hypothetical protein